MVVGRRDSQLSAFGGRANGEGDSHAIAALERILQRHSPSDNGGKWQPRATAMAGQTSELLQTSLVDYYPAVSFFAKKREESWKREHEMEEG
eukprot:1188829-Rhodomonas_salina.1